MGFIAPNSVGLGTTTTTGRNAGVGTETGTFIYNSTMQIIQLYQGDTIGWTNIAKS